MKITYNFILFSLFFFICSTSNKISKDIDIETMNNFYLEESLRISELVYESFMESITTSERKVLFEVAFILKKPEIYNDDNSDLLKKWLKYVYTSLMPDYIRYYIEKRIPSSKILKINIKGKYPNLGIIHLKQKELTPKGFLKELKQLENDDIDSKFLKRFIRDIIIAVIQPIFLENSTDGLAIIFGSDYENIKENNQLKYALERCIMSYIEHKLLKDHMDKVIDLILKYYK